MRYLTFILLVILVSCKLFQDKDATAPIVNLSIDGGDEISRGVTLYLEIKDDSKIDHVDIMIDDTTAITVTSNFDTIRFDVTPFADESEHQLYAKVADSEGNIGESEKINVVITEYPGWRIYEMETFLNPNNYGNVGWRAPIAIDEEGTVIIGTGYGLDGFYIFDPVNEDWQHFTPDNSPLTDSNVPDIEHLEDDRFVIATNHTIVEYAHKLREWISVNDIPELEWNNNETYISGIAIDKNKDVWVATYTSGILHYKGDILSKWYVSPEIPTQSFYDLVFSQNNTLYAAPNQTPIFSMRNNDIKSFDYFLGKAVEFICIVADSSDNIWVSGEGHTGYVFNGVQWSEVSQEGIMCEPMCITKNGQLYTQAWNKGLVSWDGAEWKYFDTVDSPFSNEKYFIHGSQNYKYSISSRGLAEAPNGDIWMVAGGKLMRYRPSLGGYP